MHVSDGERVAQKGKLASLVLKPKKKQNEKGKMILEVLYKLVFITLNYNYEIKIYAASGKGFASKKNEVLQRGKVEKNKLLKLLILEV